MSAEPLAIYLNDHLAGSVGALQLIETLLEHAHGSPLEARLRTLRAEIEEDQATLRRILDRIEADENRLKQAAAWVSEKVSHARLTLAARAHPGLALVEGLEALGLGIRGKLGLWALLSDLAPRDARVSGFDFEMLQTRATSQHDVVEGERIEAARYAFAAVAPLGAGTTPGAAGQ